MVVDVVALTMVTSYAGKDWWGKLFVGVAAEKAGEQWIFIFSLC